MSSAFFSSTAGFSVVGLPKIDDPEGDAKPEKADVLGVALANEPNPPDAGLLIGVVIPLAA